MRRLVLTVVLLGGLVAPAAALAVPTVLAGRAAVGDGTLVLQDAQAPTGVPVVKLRITGSVIGQVQGIGKIMIDAGPNGLNPPLVTGAGNPHDVPADKDGTAQQWGYADGFKFRAVGGTFTIVIYGSDVDLVAIGTGKVELTGMPDTPRGDGKYSLNGGDWKSLPGVTSDWIPVAADS